MTLLRGGGGGGGVGGVGFRPIILETLIMRYGFEGERPGHVPTFLGLFWVHAHNFPHVRASEQKWGQTPKS